MPQWVATSILRSRSSLSPRWPASSSTSATTATPCGRLFFFFQICSICKIGDLILLAENIIRPCRVTLVAGNILVLQAAVIVLERTLEGRACYGFRFPFLFQHEADVFDAALRHIEKTYPSHPHKPQMLAMQQ